MARSKQKEVKDKVVVKVTASQEAVLFAEWAAHRDNGALRYALRGEGRVVGSAEELAVALRWLKVSHAAAAAVSQQKKRAQALARIVVRFEKAGVVEAAPDVVVSEAVRRQLTSEVRGEHAPESEFLGRSAPKPMHHAKRERWERYQAGEQSWWIVEDMGRGAAQGRSAGKRAWSKKSKDLRAQGKKSDAPGMLRGDAMFHRGLPEERTYEQDVDLIDLIGGQQAVRPNTERSVWLTAGGSPEAKRASRAALKEGRKAKLKSKQAQETEERVERVVARLARKPKPVRPFAVAAALLAEDVRAGKFAKGSAPHIACRKRYKRVAAEVLARWGRQVEAPSREAQEAAAKNAMGRMVPVKRTVHEHEWSVSPKRTRRACATCGRVDRKVRGRWVEQARKVVVHEKVGLGSEDPRREEKRRARVAPKKAARAARLEALRREVGA